MTGNKNGIKFTIFSVSTNELKSDYSLIEKYKSDDQIQNDVFDDVQMKTFSALKQICQVCESSHHQT